MQRTNLHAIDRQGVTIISAQAKESPLADAGYSFVHCNVTGEKKDNTLLGRYWKNYPEVVYSYTSMSDVVKPEAWENTKRPDLNKYIHFYVNFSSLISK